MSQRQARRAYTITRLLRFTGDAVCFRLQVFLNTLLAIILAQVNLNCCHPKTAVKNLFWVFNTFFSSLQRCIKLPFYLNVAAYFSGSDHLRACTHLLSQLSSTNIGPRFPTACVQVRIRTDFHPHFCSSHSSQTLVLSSPHHSFLSLTHLLGPWMLIIPMSSEWSVSWHWKPWS